MAQTNNTILQLYYSTTPSLAPSGSNLSYGELALNIYDGKLYFKDSTNTVSVLASTAGASGTVQSVAITAANGFNGTVANATTNPNITLTTTITGVLKGNGTAISAATAGVDYAPATSGTSILKGDGSGGFSSAAAGTDYAPATSGVSLLYGNGSGGFSNVTVGSGISFSGGTLSATGTGGTLTSVSVASANGFAGSSSGGTTPALTITTSVTGLLKGNGTSVSAASAGTDYVVPSGNISGSAGSLATSNWTVSESGGKLYFAYSGVNKGSLDSSGNFIVTGNVTAYGTP